MAQGPPKLQRNGPPAELISRINHLGSLLENLPIIIPQVSELQDSRYSFGLDAEHVAEEGPWFAFNRNLEVSFETHKIPQGGTIIFRERGNCFKELIKMFKDVVKRLTKDTEREFLKEVWLEHLINAAELQGAKIPKRCILI